ncbi:calcium-binding protein [Candidatus Saccharibacteria bacterium]|nr:calcium-binding protein [Candidatus Saccharibacteria bacterium]
MLPARKLHPGITALIIIVLISISIAAVVIVKRNPNSLPMNTTTMTQVAPPTPQDTATSTMYRDGTYTSTGTYLSPGGQESLDLTVTLKDGIVVNSSIMQTADNGSSREYQSAFASSYKDQVVGKNVNRVSLSRVSGSSLTSNGFNDALDQVKKDAKA